MKNHERRLSLLIVAVLFSCACLSGCSERKRAISDIRSAYESENYDEAILLCEHALRHDIRGGEVYYYYGLALLAKGRDFEAMRKMDDAILVDPDLRVEIAEALYEHGRTAFAEGRRQRAATSLRAAIDYDDALDLGRLKYLVADVYFNDRAFDRAEKLYAEAIAHWPDTAAAEGAYFNLARSRLSLEDSTGALDALEAQLDAFPRGELAAEARFKMVNLLYDHASSEFVRGNYEVVIEEINRLLERTDNATLVQRARFLLGEAYERLEDYDAAYQQYKAIIDKDRGASGRIVERARAKINAFRDSGLL